jgi:hypothetical protein
MKHPNSTALFATLLLTISFPLLSSTPASDQELSAAQTALIEAQRHVERSYNFYYERNLEALSAEIFPFVVHLGRKWHQRGVNRGRESDVFSSAIAGLLDRGSDKSTFRTKNVCVLNAGSAIVTGINTRSRADGSIMFVCGVSYMFGITSEGWRIISFASHPP